MCSKAMIKAQERIVVKTNIDFQSQTCNYIWSGSTDETSESKCRPLKTLGRNNPSLGVEETSAIRLTNPLWSKILFTQIQSNVRLLCMTITNSSKLISLLLSILKPVFSSSPTPFFSDYLLLFIAKHRSPPSFFYSFLLCKRLRWRQ